MWSHYEVRERRICVKRGKWRRRTILDVTIRPMSFASLLSLSGASSELHKKGLLDLGHVSQLLPLFTNGEVPAEMIDTLDNYCIAKIWQAVNDINDLDYIHKRMELPALKGKPANPGQVLAAICHHFPAYTIEKVMALPAQTVLAIVEDLTPEEPEDQGEWEDPTPDDLKRIMRPENG